MIITIRELTSMYFDKLVECYDFSIKQVSEEEVSFSIEFISNDFVIKIEKYYREFYVSVYSLIDPDKEINLFNLLEYLLQEDTIIPESNYYRKEKNLEESFKKQLEHLSFVLFDNLRALTFFFNKLNFESNFEKFEIYWKKRHPELYS